MFGRPVSAETRRRQSKARTGHPVTSETRAKIAAGVSKGDDAGYGAVHQWLNEQFGHEKTDCEDCGATDRVLHFAFKGANGSYARDRDAYRVLCVPCHRAFDSSKEKATA